MNNSSQVMVLHDSSIHHEPITSTSLRGLYGTGQFPSSSDRSKLDAAAWERARLAVACSGRETGVAQDTK